MGPVPVDKKQLKRKGQYKRKPNKSKRDKKKKKRGRKGKERIGLGKKPVRGKYGFYWQSQAPS